MDENVESYCLLFDYQRHPNGEMSWTMRSHNEDKQLVDQLFTYNEDLVVEGYARTKDGILKWYFQDHWYTTEQLDRIIALRAFI